MLEVQLQQQQDALKQANDSRKQRDNDKVLSLERQLADVNDRLQSETDSYNKYKKMYSDMTQVGLCTIAVESKRMKTLFRVIMWLPSTHHKPKPLFVAQ